MTVIGVTGPSGAGKSEISRIFSKKYGFHVLNADDIYHDIVSAPSECLDEIKENFGEMVITENNSLDRRALSKLVFGEENRDKLELLNKITHKHVVNTIKDIISSYKSEKAVFIIDAPLLIEAGLHLMCDFSLCVLADKNIRAQRISSRDNITLESALNRINSQKEDSFYIENTDYCIENNEELQSVDQRVFRILSERRVI